MHAPLPPPLVTTFAVLPRVASARVLELLVAALDVPRPPIQLAAAEALVARASVPSHLELLRRVDQLPHEALDLIRRSAVAFDPAFRSALLTGSPEVRGMALHAVRVTSQFHQAPALVELQLRPGLPDAAAVAETLRFLVYRLYDQWRAGPEHPTEVAAAQPLRTQFLLELDRGVANYDTLSIPDEVVEGVLILGEPQHPAVKRLLWHSAPACRELAYRLLRESRHPGVLDLVAASLAQAYPHPKIFEVVKERQDPEFVAALLRRLAQRLTPPQHDNLHQFTAIDWLEPPLHVLEALPESLQPALVRFVAATQVPRFCKAAVQEWLLRHGAPEGKLAATQGLTLLDKAVIQNVVKESLASEDVGVQAWATSQLRAHAIPEAFQLLVERLDSPHTEVREAARRELAGFHLDRVLELSDEVSLEEARRAGQLLLKVDEAALPKLRKYLAQPVRQRKIQIARRAARLGLQQHVLRELIEMIGDQDVLVRRTAAEILGSVPAQESYLALQQLLDDPHPRVRSAANAALESWEQLGDFTAAAAHNFDAAEELL